jgi:hypothetical protein
MAPLENVITDDKAQRCLREGVARYPRFAAFAPRLVALPLRQGVTHVVRFGTEPPADDPDVWEFQNVVVKAYRRPD